MAKLNRRERKKEETRSRILTAAFKLFAENGFEATTIDQIAEEADIGKGTFYNYFSSKEGVLEDYLEELGAQRGQKIWTDIREAPDTRQRLAKAFQSLTSWSEDYPELIRVYIYERFNAMLKKGEDYKYNKSELYFAEILKMGQEAGDIRKDMEPLQLTNYLDAIFLIQLCKWLETGSGPGLFELAMQGIDFFLTGALNNEKD